MGNLFNLNSLTIKAKIYTLTAVLMGAMVISIVYALNSMNSIGEELVTIAEEDIPLTNVVSQITIHQLEQAINFERALRFGGEMGNEPAAEKHFHEAIEKFKRYSTEIHEELGQGKQIAEEAMTLAHSDEEHAEFKHVDDILKRVEKEHADFAKHAEHVFELVKQQKMHEPL